MKVTHVSMLYNQLIRDYWNRGDRGLRKFYDTQLRNNTQKGTRVVTGQAIKPQVDRRICIGQLFEQINHISSFLCIIIRAPTLKNIVITSSVRQTVCLSVRPHFLCAAIT